MNLPLEYHINDISVPRTASDDLKASARGWIDKLVVKNGAYPPDSYPNPGKRLLFMGFPIGEAGHIGLTSWYIALAYHNAQLQASAFREQYDPDSFEDLTEPKVGSMHKVCFLLSLMLRPGTRTSVFFVCCAIHREQES